MSYTALYRKYRPNCFNNIVGQSIITQILINSIKSNHISHAYLFTGPRGTGKTSTAKVLAHAINCNNFVDDVCNECNSCTFLNDNDNDIIEIDAASNNGVDEIRNLIDNVKLLPTFCKYKVYIIDEVHMLSSGAFNALLKTLEEPPSHVVFILATTEPKKIPLTILSRCQRFDFNKISEDVIINRLNYILSKEKIRISDNIINYIAKISDGGMRDAINILDQILSLDYNSIDIDDIDKISGRISINLINDLFMLMINGDYKKIISTISDNSKFGFNYSQIVNKMLIILRDLLINKQVSNFFDKTYSDMLNGFNINSDNIIKITNLLNELLKELKNSSDQKMIFEIYIFHITNIFSNKEYTDLVITNKSSSIDINENSEYRDNYDTSNKISNISDVQNSNKKENMYNLPIDFEINSSELMDLKKIRINNVLAEANKSLLKTINDSLDLFNDFITNKRFNKIVSLLLDSKIVVASDKYLLFTFADIASVLMFDKKYLLIEEFLLKCFKHEYKVVSLSIQEWNDVKNKFIIDKKNRISYNFINEACYYYDVISEFSSDKIENDALNIFGKDTISLK